MICRFGSSAFTLRSSIVTSVLLAGMALALPGMARAQPVSMYSGETAVAGTDTQPSAPTMLHITILEGDEALNNIRDRTAREPIVQVEDENHKPVAGALVLFSVHGGPSGAGASINGLSTATLTTDATGKATLKGLQVNQTSGSFTIDVTASVGKVVATATIHESNVMPGSNQTQNNQDTTPAKIHKPGLKYGKYIVGGGAVVGVVVGLIFGLHTHSTGISLGAGSVHP